MSVIEARSSTVLGKSRADIIHASIITSTHFIVLVVLLVLEYQSISHPIDSETNRFSPDTNDAFLSRTSRRMSDAAMTFPSCSAVAFVQLFLFVVLSSSRSPSRTLLFLFSPSCRCYRFHLSLSLSRCDLHGKQDPLAARHHPSRSRGGKIKVYSPHCPNAIMSGLVQFRCFHHLDVLKRKQTIECRLPEDEMKNVSRSLCQQ